MKKILVTLMLISQFLVISACGNGADTGKGGSYQILAVSESGDFWSLDSNEDPESYEQDKLIVTINKKTEPDETPGNGQSNYYDEGTKIYSVKGAEGLAMAIEPSGEKSILRREDN
ncbi:hypothetical protein ACFRCQ_24645 [Cytobacillus firmus]|uniref:Lipoprotein n=1 Tax=Cytobacillus oceanisediminis TaxID=665099 RepID=A0ABX3CKW1_9BACI|nr:MULTISPECIES: hypothetical protein [Bacillaceae]MBN8202579.1 hypothetical protein [Bacillus sp. NTK034]OHX41403.1 hypothetical protein BBV17_28830 [Cytobacillus oceanisediminis]